MKKEKHDKETLAIVSVYDRDGIIDEYLIFYLASLRVIADRLVVAVNGELTRDGREKLMTVADEIYRRSNTGFDFGAYKDVLKNYLQPGESEEYQELVLCNDTCYGPFESFEDIFEQMRERDVEFWSINYIEDPLLPHFQSYFMVFSGSAIHLLADFLENEVDSGTINPIQACGYEHGLSETILLSGIRTDYYTSKRKGYHNLDIFGAPDYAMELLGFPLLKRRAFSDELSVKDNCRRVLYMVVQRGNYPIAYILENVYRIYHRDVSEALQKSYITEMSFFEKNYTSREEVIAFCRKHKKVYLYGNGYMSVLFMARFQRYMNAFGGYVVSDEYYIETQDQTEQVCRLSQTDPEAPLIVAMTEKVAMQIAGRVRERKNVLFLSMDSERIKYMEERKSE
ncbi:MAG: rhamnan synthesis F family protein [Lachnospiraceae bacterium]|nr:rhamnan synthesis F family protein [Lachnospiraceae bacterium]